MPRRTPPGATGSPSPPLAPRAPTSLLPRLVLNSASIAWYPAGATFGPRRLKDFEMVWLIEGDAVYRCRAGTFDAPQQSVVLCRAGDVDGFDWDRKRPTVHGYFHFTLHEAPAHWPARVNWPVVRAMRADEIGWAAMTQVTRHTDDLAHELAVLSAGMALRSFVEPAFARTDPAAPPMPATLSAAMRLIHQRLAARPPLPVTLEQLADASAVSREHLCRLFSRHFNRSPLAIVEVLRLNRALSLMIGTNYAVKEVARQIGYSTPFHFCRRFTARFGRSPSQLRHAARAGLAPPAPLPLRDPMPEPGPA